MAKTSQKESPSGTPLKIASSPSSVPGTGDPAKNISERNREHRNDSPQRLDADVGAAKR